jgi:hypothetical protein
MQCRALIAAAAAGVFAVGMSAETVAAEHMTAGGVAETAEMTARGRVTTVEPALSYPRRYFGWRPWTYRPRSYGYDRYAGGWRYWGQWPRPRYGRGYRAPYSFSSPYRWQQPWRRSPAWRSYRDERGYAAAPWRWQD